jgi:ubiquitin-conjugating enzyme E2 Q
LFPTVTLSEFAVTRSNTANQTEPGVTISSAVPATPATTPPPPALVPAKLAIYNQNFDDFDNVAKAETIVMLLELLPSIKEMRTFLIQQSRTSEPNLRGWKDRISPAALGMLRWIIASNRSCLVQVDKCPGQDDNDVAMAKVRLDQRVSNISENWVQFRFAQGSPDKEQRFLNALRAQQASFEAKYPTIFAWHGSPLANWHSIIRAGLDFKETLHGRAFGHGVYHAIDQATSVGYAQHNQATWQGSELKISSAMSLNEIVNCPGQFISSNPYLVVQHIDWIQCRYLFVQVQGGTDAYSAGGNSNNISRYVKYLFPLTFELMIGSTPDPSIEVEQDPKLLAKSTLHKPIGVPLCAVSVSRAFRIGAKDDTPSIKKRKHASSGSKLAIEEMGVSEGETLSDIEFMFTSDEETPKTEEKAELVIL